MRVLAGSVQVVPTTVHVFVKPLTSQMVFALHWRSYTQIPYTTVATHYRSVWQVADDCLLSGEVVCKELRLQLIRKFEFG